MSWFRQDVLDSTGMVEVDMTQVRRLSDEELFTQAGTFPKMGRNRVEQYDGRLREAIIVVLYERDYTNGQIAQAFGLSTQRIQQIVTAYYNRMERVWEQERAQRQGS